MIHGKLFSHHRLVKVLVLAILRFPFPKVIEPKTGQFNYDGQWRCTRLSVILIPSLIWGVMETRVLGSMVKLANFSTFT